MGPERTQSRSARTRRVSFTALLLHPLYWPKWIRRLGIVLFPLAVPAWLALIVLAFLLTSFGPLGEIFDKAWNGRQRRPFRYEGYSYYGSMPPTRRIVLVPSPEPDPERLDAAEQRRRQPAHATERRGRPAPKPLTGIPVAAPMKGITVNDDYANAPARHRAEWAKPTLKRLNRRQVPDQAIETFERLAAAQKREMRTQRRTARRVLKQGLAPKLPAFIAAFTNALTCVCAV